MSILLRVMAWNLNEPKGHNEHDLLQRIANVIIENTPDVVLLSEVMLWTMPPDLLKPLDYLDYFNPLNHFQSLQISMLTDLPYFQIAEGNWLGLTGVKHVAVLSRYPLGIKSQIDTWMGWRNIGYPTLKTSIFVDGRIHHIYSTRFNRHNFEENFKGHQLAVNSIKTLSNEDAVIFGGDFNSPASLEVREDGQIDPETKANFQFFVDNSGLTNVLPEQQIIDHIFFRGSYAVRQAQAVAPPNNPSDHSYVFAELSSTPWPFRVSYGSTIKLKHAATGKILHSYPHNYEHPNSSRQQQVMAFASADDNDYWQVKGPDGTGSEYMIGQTILHNDIIRLEHITTRRNLHSHSAIPSPVTGQQEVTCFGTDGAGDSNDNWRIEIEDGGIWEAGKRIRLVHCNTSYALHSHRGHSHPKWTSGQQEITCFQNRDDNDWWYMFELRSEKRIPLLVRVEPLPIPLGRPVTLTVFAEAPDRDNLNPIQGKVEIDNNIVADTNTPFSYIFGSRSITGWVITNDYPVKEIRFTFKTYSISFANMINGIGGDQL